MYHLLVDRSYQPYLEGDGTQSRDFCFIDNVVQANILAAELPILCEGQAYNIAQGHSTSLLECKDLLEEITGEDLVLAQRPQRVGDVAITWANIDKAQRDLGYMPGTNFTEQIIAMATWYRDSYASEVFPGPCGE
jgi:nucleoside-diphosphate-sugar epimerase